MESEQKTTLEKELKQMGKGRPIIYNGAYYLKLREKKREQRRKKKGLTDSSKE